MDIRIAHSRSSRRTRERESGVTTVEYAVMLVLVALAVAVFGLGLSDSVTGVFSRLVKALSLAS